MDANDEERLIRLERTNALLKLAILVMLLGGGMLAMMATVDHEGEDSPEPGTMPAAEQEQAQRQAEQACPVPADGTALSLKPRLDSLPAGKELNLDCGNNVSMQLVLIPAGKFLMGSPANEEERFSDEGPQREVTITRPFYMGIYEVTQAQYQAVMGSNPSYFEGEGANNPVETVSWNDAVEFCQRLSQRTGKTVRLPTEAEWEYACRAGTTTPFHTGQTISTDQANYDGDYTYGNGRKGEYRGKTIAVGSFKPNAFGLYDMHGNVWEWCSDWYADTYANANNIDPAGPASGSYRVLRGGSWSGYPWGCRSAFRLWRISPDRRDVSIGFRVVVAGDVD